MFKDTENCMFLEERAHLEVQGEEREDNLPFKDKSKTNASLLRSFNSGSVFNSYSKDDVLGRESKLLRLATEDFNALEEIVWTTSRTSANRCKTVYNFEGPNIYLESPINCKQDEVVLTTPTLQLEKMKLLPSVKHISLLLRSQKSFRENHMPSHKIFHRHAVSLTLNQLEKPFIQWRDLKGHDTFMLSKDVCKADTSFSFHNFLTPLCTFLEHFLISNKDGLNQVLEAYFKVKSQLFGYSDAVVPDATILPDSQGFVNFTLDLAVNRSHRMVPENNKSIYIFGKEGIVCQSDRRFEFCPDFSNYTTDMETQSLECFSNALLNILRFFNQVNFEFDRPTLSPAFILVSNPELLKLWQILKALACQIGANPLNQLLSAILSLTDERPLDRGEIQSVVDQFLLILAPYYNEKENIIDPECREARLGVSGKKASASTQFLATADESDKRCSYNIVDKANECEEAFLINDSFNNGSGQNESWGNHENTEKEFGLPGTSTLKDCIEPKTSDNKAGEDQLVPDSPEEKAEMNKTTCNKGDFEADCMKLKTVDKKNDGEVHLASNEQEVTVDARSSYGKAEFMWVSKKDICVQTEPPNKLFVTREHLIRPIRVGLSRRQRTKPLHPYLTVRRQLKEPRHWD